MLEPEGGGVMAIGSGGNYALAAARALDRHRHSTPKRSCAKSMGIAADICVYTNHNLVIESLDA